MDARQTKRNPEGQDDTDGKGGKRDSALGGQRSQNRRGGRGDKRFASQVARLSKLALNCSPVPVAVEFPACHAVTA